MTREEAIKYWDGLRKTFSGQLEKEENYFGRMHLQTSIDAIDMAIFALRQQETVTNRNGLNEPTNADSINAMTIEEKAEFLSSIAYGRETPWCEQFAEKFCKSCPTTTCIVEGYHHPLELHECDFSDGKCPHGREIVWWLQQPAEDSANG